MPSPFPGMSPYLEQGDVWRNFHERFISMAAEVIGAQVQPHYIVKIYEHVYVHELPAESRRLLGRADIGLAAIPPAASASAAVGLLVAPARVRLLAVHVGVVRPKESTFFPLARVGPTTPTRATTSLAVSIDPTEARCAN
jgi:hypothetical protein